MEVHLQAIYSSIAIINQILCSGAKSHKIVAIINNIREGKTVVTDYVYYGIISDMALFESLKCFDNQHGDLETRMSRYLSLLQVAKSRLHPMLEFLIKDICSKCPDFRKFMITHSVLGINATSLIALYMRKWLIPTVNEIKEWANPDVPSDLLKQFQIFDPVPIGFEKFPVTIEFESDQSHPNRQQIRIIDENFTPNHSYDQYKASQAVDVKSFLAGFDVIQC